MIVQNNEILLGMKKRGFGEGWWNGFGGKVQSGETLEEAALRELYEEAGLRAVELEKRAILTFLAGGWDELPEVHVFKIENFAGEPRESEEMMPQWFAFEEIPYDTMWDDDRYWIPLFLENKKFTGEFHFDTDKKLLHHEIRELDSLL